MGDVASRLGDIKEDKDFAQCGPTSRHKVACHTLNREYRWSQRIFCSFLTVNGIDATFVRRDARARLAVRAGMKQARG